MKQVPLNLLTLYADLMQRSQTEGLPAATISRRLEQGKRRLYDDIRSGGKREQHYLGTVGDPDAENKANAYRRAADHARDKRKIVSTLKAAGIPAPPLVAGRLLEALSASGLFDCGMMLVGTVAFQTYPCLVGGYLVRWRSAGC